MNPIDQEIDEQPTESFAIPDWLLLREQAFGLRLNGGRLLTDMHWSELVAIGRDTCPYVYCGHRVDMHDNFSGCTEDTCMCTTKLSSPSLSVLVAALGLRSGDDRLLHGVRGSEPVAVGLTTCPNVSCQHPRTAHSSSGCLEWLDNNTTCSCKKKFMELSAGDRLTMRLGRPARAQDLALPRTFHVADRKPVTCG